VSSETRLTRPDTVHTGLTRVLVPVGLLILFPLIFSSGQNVTFATTAVIYAIIASGLGLLYGQLGVLSMSQVLLWGIGSYTCAILITDHGWTFWTVLPVCLFGTAAAGALTSLPALRLRGHYLLIAGFILTEIGEVVEGQASFTGAAEGKLVSGVPHAFLGLNLGSLKGYYYLCVACLILAVLLSAVIGARRIGRRFLAIRENASLAQTLGIDPRRQLVVGFTLSGLYAGLGGLLYAVNLHDVEPGQFGLNSAVLLPLVMMIGGASYVWGPTLGAFIVVFLPEVIHASPNAAQAINGILLIAIILLVPDGALYGVGRVAARLRSQLERDRRKRIDPTVSR
jgi:branched-chain amino acid transport system permease protein